MLLFSISSVGISRRHKVGTGHYRRVAKRTVSASKRIYSTAGGQSFSAAVSPSTIVKPSHKNQDPYLPLDGNVCRSISPSSTINFSDTSADDATESNLSTSTKLPPINSDYNIFNNSGHSVTKIVTAATTAKSRSVSIIFYAVLQPPALFYEQNIIRTL